MNTLEEFLASFVGNQVWEVDYSILMTTEAYTQ
jgi:hypothetical protein